MALLDKEEDPYNRKPLKEAMLIPLHDLKREIQLWKEEQRAKLKAKSAQIFKEKALQKRDTAMQAEIEDSSMGQSFLF